MKFSANDLFKERASAYYAEIRKYTRYMFNDHLAFVLVFALGAVLYYYSGWIRTIDESFPAPFIMAAVLGAVLAWSPVYTYIKPPDTVYLLPLESELKAYFQKAVWTSFAAQSYVLIALLAFAMPMYAKTAGTGYENFFVFLSAVLAAKIWNLFCRFRALNTLAGQTRTMDMAVRFLLNVSFLSAVFLTEYVGAGAAVLLGLLWLFYIRRLGNRPLKWELLAELEGKRMAAFYRLANMFTDVPHLRGTVKRRAWLDGLLPGPEKGTYTYLLFRTFVRLNEYIGLFVRLTVIAALIITFSGLLPIQLISALLFLYLTGFQLLPIWVKHGYLIWPKLYPEGEEGKQRALQLLLMRVLLIQSAVFGIAALSGGWLEATIVLSASVTFTLFFVWIYTPGRLKKMNRF
ncbi:ABC transporter permease [Domibacillus sp. PGB-M46]|uniref:ABC transporter permease n=1 Tax=Domibacillus sp. PGB-M46 TaxID=2910255 RepID=UPI001F5A8E22|nr:ABC transporter permease [Domibacillus sp. PGB-M46]MCI2253498.1 ABC transporter permease [Domibacillus sp. PGB-M46]